MATVMGNFNAQLTEVIIQEQSRSNKLDFDTTGSHSWDWESTEESSVSHTIRGGTDLSKIETDLSVTTSFTCRADDLVLVWGTRSGGTYLPSLINQQQQQHQQHPFTVRKDEGMKQCEIEKQREQRPRLFLRLQVPLYSKIDFNTR